MMTSTVQDRVFMAQVRTTNLERDAAEGNRRAQGWFIVIGASVVLWVGIIVAIVGIASLNQ
jgi:hypothetical protein